MKRKLTTLWMICIAMFMAGSGTIWGQQYVLQSSVNNEFGAGESSYITVGSHEQQNVKSPWNVANFSYTTDGATPLMSFGGTYSNTLGTTPPDILLGGVKNTVIRTYTGDGFAMGWVSVLTKLWPTTGQSTLYPDEIYTNNVIQASYLAPTAFTKNNAQPILEFSFNKFNAIDFASVDANGNCQNPWHATWGTACNVTSGQYAPCGGPLYESEVTAIGNGTSRVKMWHHDKSERTVQVSPSARPHGLYTSTIDQSYNKTWSTGFFDDGRDVTISYPVDDGVALVQFTGQTMASGLALANQSTNKLKSDIAKPLGDIPATVLTNPADWGDNTKTQNLQYLTNYRRPTTILIEGGSTANPHNHLFNTFLYKDITWNYEIDSVLATSLDEHGNTTGKRLTSCNSGCMNSYIFRVQWNHELRDGATLVDGAIALQPNAWVCVENNVSDATTTPATEHTTADAPDDKTDAILVFPNITGRFTLRVKGNVEKVNMAQDATGRPNPFYTQATFPRPAANIYLYKDAANAHPFASAYGGLKQFAHTGITKYSIPEPTDKAEASIFGIYGNYDWVANNAEIHTDTVPTNFNGNNPGVIEVGPVTAGKEHYHVYSGGILKNFESCTDLANFAMEFGNQYGKTPEFKFTEKETMYILNYGNNAANACPADIRFNAGATQALADAFTGATDEGAMQIQALSDVEFRADATLDATLKGNNLYMLSDAGNVVTQKFDYKGQHVGNTGLGLLTLWAEDRTPSGSDFSACANDWSTNRNSNRGNVYINDNMKVERPAAPTPGGLHTETNMIAANNIRTASFEFESQNLDHDTTNIISRKGDVWLGYSIGAPVYDATGNATSNTYKFSDNTFTYKVNTATNAGVLNIKAGWDETDNGKRWEGGNIYFTTINAEMMDQGAYPTNITIPFSNEYYCGSDDPVTGDLHERRGEAMQRYEHAGIIGGVGRCGREHAWAEYEGKFTNPIVEGNADAVAVPSLNYKGNNGNLTVDAGQRGNIIMNTGTELDFQNNQGSAFFRTRFGDIDLRNKTNVQGLRGSLLLLAQTDNLSDLAKVGFCGCAEERNNVYLQDFQYTPNDSSGSIFVGADNNIKLNYGGLQNKGTRHDPFLSTDYNPANPGEKIGTEYPCNNGDYHCDMVDGVNKARDFKLDFSQIGGGSPVASGGFAAVASDYIDVYKTMIYKGGKGSGMSDVPGEGTLHGENVAGYGLYMKTQGNKNNWNTNILKYIPKCPMGCEGGCDKGDYLHMVSRMTFHSDARIYAHDQKVFLASPVIEVFGDLELNTKDEEGTRTEIVLQADSLILHDSLIVTGDKLKYRSWSGINGDKPIMKFGYSRRTPPVQEFKYKDIECAPCYSYIPGSTDPKHMLDTITIKFKHGDTFVERFNTVVFDHTVLTFVTDSFDHVQGPPILNARFFIDTLKVRNQVALYADAKHEHDAHFELISEEQMQSKNYAGVYTRHYHMEPIGACGRNYSELWLSDDKALDVITTSTFGGFGYQHSDVHVETEAHLNPGFTSLRLRGQCYEQKCGTLKMKDLRLDGGAQLHFSVGTTKGINGEYSDAIDVEKLTTYGTVDVNIEVRPCERMMNRCYPIIYYKSQTPGSLKNLNLVPKRIKIDGEEVPLVLDTSTEGVVYVCVGNVAPPTVVHSVTIPSVAGVTTTPPTGIAYAVSHSNFEFKAKYSTEKPFVVRTNRMFNGETEVLEGKKNSNGEYEYVIRQVTQNIVLKFGPDYVANMSVNGTAVWSHGETIYIRVEREDIASIYSVAGQLVKRVELPEGDTPIPMQRGVYVVTLKDGSVHKVIVK